MSLNKSHALIQAGWLVAVAATFASSIALGMPLTLAQGIGWLLLGFVPVFIMKAVFRGAPPPTISEVLYQTEHPARAVTQGPASRPSSDDATR